MKSFKSVGPASDPIKVDDSVRALEEFMAQVRAQSASVHIGRIGIAHTDISGGNVMLTSKTDAVKIIDLEDLYEGQGIELPITGVGSIGQTGPESGEKELPPSRLARVLEFSVHLPSWLLDAETAGEEIGDALEVVEQRRAQGERELVLCWFLAWTVLVAIYTSLRDRSTTRNARTENAAKTKASRG